MAIGLICVALQLVLAAEELTLLRTPLGRYGTAAPTARSRRTKRCPATFTFTRATEKARLPRPWGWRCGPRGPGGRSSSPSSPKAWPPANRPPWHASPIASPSASTASRNSSAAARAKRTRTTPNAGWRNAAQAIASGQYRLVILDEANLGPTLRLFPVEELLALVDARPDGVELVLTGRVPTAACWTGPTWYRNAGNQALLPPRRAGQNGDRTVGMVDDRLTNLGR